MKRIKDQLKDRADAAVLAAEIVYQKASHTRHVSLHPATDEAYLYFRVVRSVYYMPCARMKQQQQGSVTQSLTAYCASRKEYTDIRDTLQEVDE